MKTLTIDSIRVRDRGDATSRRRALTRLSRVDPVLTGPPAEILVIRRLDDPAPGALSRPTGCDGLARWESQLNACLSDLHQSAARPTRGEFSDAAQAVRFTDEAEMLACFAEKLAVGQRTVWWARTLASRLPAGAGPEALIAQNLHLLPALCEVLLERGTAVEVFSLVPPATALSLLRDIGGLSAVPLAPAASQAKIADASVVATDEHTLADVAPAPLIDAISRLPDAQAYLLATAWTRRNRPRLTGERLDFATWQIVQRIRTRHLSIEASDTQSTPQGPTLDERHKPSASGTSAHRNNTRRKTSPQDAERVHPLSTSPQQEEQTPSSLSARTDTAAAAHIKPDKHTSGRNALPDAVVHQNKLPDRPSDATNPAGTESQIEPFHETATRLGGVLFLINLFVGGIPLRAPGLGEALALAERADDGSWCALERLARALIDLPRVASGQNKSLTTDPLWRLLAMLDGRPPEAIAKPEPADVEAARKTARWIEKAAWGADGMPEGANVGTLLCRPALVHATPAHIDVVFAAEDVSLPARRAGLDLNPGWQPRFGRVIAFHYRD